MSVDVTRALLHATADAAERYADEAHVEIMRLRSALARAEAQIEEMEQQIYDSIPKWEARGLVEKAEAERDAARAALRSTAPNEYHGGPCWCGIGTSLKECQRLRRLAPPAADATPSEGGTDG